MSSAGAANEEGVRVARSRRARRRLVALAAVGLIVAGGAALALVLRLGHWIAAQPPARHPHATRQVQVLGHELTYHERGAGEPTFLLLHGFGGSGASWLGLSDAMDCGRRISVDLLGFGASSRPAVEYSLDTHSRHVVGLMDALGIERAVLVGHSMGGSVAAYTAARVPERVIALALMAPSGVPGSLDGYGVPLRWLYRPGLPNRLALWVAETDLFRWLHPHSLARQALGVTHSYDDAFTAALTRIEAPTLLLWSPGDSSFDKRQHYIDRIHGLQFIEAPAEAGHGVVGDDPTWAARAICELAGRAP